jgi:hypothetical protein
MYKFFVGFLFTCTIFSCIKKKPRNYFCERNCGNITINGKFDNASNGTNQWTMGREVSFSLRSSIGNIQGFNTLGTATSDGNGVFSFNTVIDTTILGSNQYSLIVNPLSSQSEDFVLLADSNCSLKYYPNQGIVNSSIKIFNLCNGIITIHRSFADVFDKAIFMLPTVQKRISGDYSYFKYDVNIADRIYVFKSIENTLIQFGVRKHSGKFDTIPNTNGTGTMEVGNVEIKDSFLLTPNVMNTFTLNY